MQRVDIVKKRAFINEIFYLEKVLKLIPDMLEAL